MTQRWVDEDISSSYYFSFITFIFLFIPFCYYYFFFRIMLKLPHIINKTMQSFEIHVCVLYIIIFIEILSNHNHFRRKKGNSWKTLRTFLLCRTKDVHFFYAFLWCRCEVFFLCHLFYSLLHSSSFFEWKSIRFFQIL